MDLKYRVRFLPAVASLMLERLQAKDCRQLLGAESRPRLTSSKERMAPGLPLQVTRFYQQPELMEVNYSLDLADKSPIG